MPNPSATPVDPTVYKFLTYGFTASFGLITMLMGKIIWDWFTNRRLDRDELCPIHGQHQKDLDYLKERQQRNVDRDEFKELARQVKEGQTAIYKEIAEINKSIAVFAERIKNV